MTLQARSQSFVLTSLHHNENFLEAAKKQQDAKKAVSGASNRAGVPLANITNTHNAQQKPALKQQAVNKPNQIIGPAPVQQQQAPKLTFVTSRAPAQQVALPATKLPDLPLPNIGQLSLSTSNYSDFSPMTIEEEDFAGSSDSEESSTEDIVDIDYWDADDPRAVSEYVEEIYDYLRKREAQFRLQPNFLSAQIDIKEKMRLVLLDWFVEVHHKFQLLTETLFIAANILDRYLSMKQVARNNLQLVGMGALFIAAKYEEMYPPCCDDFVYMSDGTYTKDDLLEMEGVILNTLQFNISVPLPIHFLRRYNKASGTEFKTYCLCRYILELSLFDVQMHKFTPSQIAAGAFYLARVITKEALAWTPTLAHHTKLEEHEVKPIAVELHASVVKFHKAPLTALKTKFSRSEYERVALMPELQ